MIVVETPGEQQADQHPHVPHQEGDQEAQEAEPQGGLEGKAGQDQVHKD